MQNLDLTDVLAKGALIVGVLSLFIEITPIKWCPLTWLAKKIVGAVNKELIAKIEEISDQVNDVRKTVGEGAAKLARSKILEFGDELIYQTEKRHSKDSFDNVIQCITEYDAYCKAHPDFRNHMTASAEKLILDRYRKCMEKHNFL